MTRRFTILSVFLSIALLVTTFTWAPPRVHADGVDVLANRLTTIYHYLNVQEKEEVRQAFEKTKNLTDEQWKGIIGTSVVQAIDSKTANGKAIAIVKDLAQIIYNGSDPNIDFKKLISEFRDEYADEFDAVFGRDVTVDLMLDFIAQFESNMEATVLSEALFGGESTFKEAIQMALNMTLAANEFKQLDGKLAEALGIGVDGLFAIKDRLNAAVDPHMKAREALISGLARGKGAKISGPDSLTVGKTAEFKFVVTYQGNDLILSNDVKWETDNSSLATFTGNVLTAKAAGTVQVKAVALGITILTKTVTITSSGSGGSGGNNGGGTGGGPGGGTGGGTGGDTGGGTGGDNGGGTGDDENPVDPADSVEVTVNTDTDGRTVATVEIAKENFMKVLENADEGATVKLSITEEADAVHLTLPSDILEAVKEKDFSLEIVTSIASYVLPVTAIDLEAVASSFNTDVANLQVKVVIEKAAAEVVEDVKDVAQSLQAQVVADPISFTVELVAGDKKQEIDSFNVYVERTVHLKQVVNKKAAVGVLYDPDTDTFNPVPTLFEEKENGQVAVLKRPGNSVYTVVSISKDFEDISSHWAKDTIQTMASKLIVNGVSQDRFAPQSNLTRAQLAAHVVRALGLLPKAEGASFTDVRSTDWFAGYVNTVKEIGVMNGYPNGTFKPNQWVTREEAAAVLARAMSYAGHDLKVSEKEQHSILARFGDQAMVKGWARAEIAKVVKEGIINGYHNNTIQPKKNITRAEAVVMIQRMMIVSKLMN